jgi:hypothetical protein
MNAEPYKKYCKNWNKGPFQTNELYISWYRKYSRELEKLDSQRVREIRTSRRNK